MTAKFFNVYHCTTNAYLVVQRMLRIDHVPPVLGVVLRVVQVRAPVVELVFDVPEQPPLHRHARQLVLVHHPVRHAVVALVLEPELRPRQRLQRVRAAGHG